MSNLVIHSGGDELRMQQVVSYLQNEIPEYWAARQVGTESDPHVVAGDFAIWLSNAVNTAESLSSPLLLRAFELVNNLAQAGDDHVKNLVEISILEPLIDELDNASNVRSRLRGEALALYDRILHRWYN